MSTLEKAEGRKLSLPEWVTDMIAGRTKWYETIEKMQKSISMPLKNIVNKVRSRFSKPPRLVGHCIVIDAGNNTLVAIGTHIPTIVFLRDSLMDTIYDAGIVSPEILQIKESGPRTYPEWSWDLRSRVFSKTNPVIVTEGMRERAVLAAKKGEIISRASYLINRARDKVNGGLFFQETIYATKQKQAQLLKDAGFDQTLAASAPYVVQHADESGMSLQEAAEDILFQAQLFHEHLEKTEKVRLALFRRIKRAKTPEELDEMMERFQRDGVA
jgi:hypothetical protein